MDIELDLADNTVLVSTLYGKMCSAVQDGTKQWPLDATLNCSLDGCAVWRACHLMMMMMIDLDKTWK